MDCCSLYLMEVFMEYLRLLPLSKFLDLLLTSRLGSRTSRTPPRQSTSSTWTPSVERSSVQEEEKESGWILLGAPDDHDGLKLFGFYYIDNLPGLCRGGEGSTIGDESQWTLSRNFLTECSMSGFPTLPSLLLPMSSVFSLPKVVISVFLILRPESCLIITGSEVKGLVTFSGVK